VAETGSVDAAMVARVAGDSTLRALCPGGVYFGVAVQGAESFVVIDRLAHSNDRSIFGGNNNETYLYLVKAVLPGSSSIAARAAGDRIRQLFDLVGDLAIAGYALLAPVEEVESVRIVEVDDTNPDRRVQHWGGHYEVTVQRTG